jgi:TonB-dependent SusC/RagA subfamily outer membrane receptor
MNKLKTFAILFLAFFSMNAISQENIKLKLTIKDSDNKPVPGAVVLIDGVKQTRLANAKGVFRIKLDEAPKEISVFSPKIGIKKVKYTGIDNINITITGGNDSYVVNTSSNKVDTAMQFKDIYDYMRGKVAGVNISGNNSINIRGYNSVNGSTTPMFMLNDVQVDQATFGDVVPTTIKSIVILKGPETATYGSRGSNGVIKVTTL